MTLTFKDEEKIRLIVREEVKEQIQNETRLLPTKDEFFAKMDELMGEVKAKRETQELHAQEHIDIHDKFESVGAKLKLDLSY